MTNAPWGIVLGRFQPLHLGHIEYLNAAKSLCDRLVVGITNPDPDVRLFSAADPGRSTPESNPYSYFERHVMIEESLLDAGWDSHSFLILAAPLQSPDRLVAYLPSPAEAIFFVTIYDAWGEQKAQELRDVGYEVVTLWRRSHSERLTSGTQIREAIRDDQPWKSVVPPAVARQIEVRRRRRPERGS